MKKTRKQMVKAAQVQAKRDIKAEAIRAKAAADAKKAAADAVEQAAAHTKHVHEATVAEHERLRKEHADADAEAQRLAAETEAAKDAEYDALPWHTKLFSGR